MNFKTSLEEFLNLHKERAVLVKDVRFRMRVRDEKIKTGREVLAISVKDLSPAEKQQLLADYHRLMKGTISFPAKSRATHLKVRFEDSLFSFFCYSFLSFLPRFRRQEFQVPQKTSLEVALRLSKPEVDRLRLYIEQIQKNPRRKLGWFSMKGTQKTRGLIHDNRPLQGCHNCTSWIATAPLGSLDEKGVTPSLLELLGADRDLLVGTNPGWWTNWLAATASPERLSFVIYWSEKSLADTLKEDVIDGKNLEWDFNRR